MVTPREPVDPSFQAGYRKAADREGFPTRIARAHIVDIRYPLPGLGVPRTVVDCIGTTSRQPIMGAVVAGWSGAFWQSDRPNLQPTRLNLKSRLAFDPDPAVRMQQMSQDLEPTGWDGDEVIIAFFERTPVIIGTLEHALSYQDVADNGLEAQLEDGRRLRDSTGIFPGSPLFTASRIVWPDAQNMRWGQYLSTFWERAGAVGELREVDLITDTLKSSTHARWEFSTEVVKARGQLARVSIGSNATGGIWFDSVAIELRPTPGVMEFTIDGQADGSDTTAMLLTSQAGGDQVGDNPAGAARYPELRSVVNQLQVEISELQSKHNELLEGVQQLQFALKLTAQAGPPGTGVVEGQTALALLGIFDDFLLTNKTKASAPAQSTLDAMRSGVVRIGL